ncbi:HNH endonuclease [Novosphingobium sp. FSW06-99]|uniref:HNH endonuclease n=1 Tax=Novosphingobium sp. FSW06-99 TaxID=1739113 RepID=UPI0009E72BEE|nr:HNH endonuclease [Novosphingobium sp. FSW06-99]
MMKRAKITTFKRGMATASGRSVALPPKTVAPVYQTREHRAWRDQVIARAGARCEFVDENGERCKKSAPYHRLFADHMVEIKDGGPLHDIANGQCLCGAHHAAKTARARAARRFT